MVSERRALSTIVGALLFLVILVSAFGSVLTAINFMTGFQEKSIEVSSQISDQLSEEFGTRIRIGSDCKLDIEVVNNSPIAVEVTELFLINTTDNTIERYDVSNAVIAPEARINVTDSSLLSLDEVPSQTIILTTDNEYVVKIVTNLGTMKEKAFATGSTCGNSPLIGKLIAIPPEIAPGDTITVLFVVVNKEDVDIRNVEVANSAQDYDLTVSPAAAVEENIITTPGKEPTVVAGGTVIFSWDLTLNAAVGTTISVSTSAVDSFGDSTGVQELEIKVTREYQKDIISQKLIVRPEVFLITPSPFGESTGQALWGAVIANPTDISFSVSRVTFVLAAVGSESSQNIVASPCGDDGLQPNVDTEWSCPNENLIDWKDAGTLEPVIGPREVKAFMVKVNPGSTGSGNADLAAFTTSVAVHTSVGQFSKGDYASGMEGNPPGVIGQVYATNTNTTSGLLTDTNWVANITIAADSTKRINVTLADFDSGSDYILGGSKLIINVPSGWELGDIYLDNARFDAIGSGSTVTEYADGSFQINARLKSTELLGDTAAEAAVISFDLTTPVITEDRIYVLYCLANGETNKGQLLGATAEIPLRVDAP